MILPILAVGFQSVSGSALVKQVAERLSRIRALSVTLTTAYTNPPRQVIETYAVLKGGYLRYGQGDSQVIVTPDKSWLLWPEKREFKSKPAPPKGSPQNPFTGMPGLFGEGILPAKGWATETKLEGRAAYLVTVDSRKVLPKNAELAFYFSKDTKLPLGFRIIQGTLTIQGVYSNLKLDPPLKPSDFSFRPGKGWKPYSG